jgi:hypothetical protein
MNMRPLVLILTALPLVAQTRVNPGQIGPIIPSAATLVIPSATGQYAGSPWFGITGNTGVTAISGAFPGQQGTFTTLNGPITFTAGTTIGATCTTAPWITYVWSFDAVRYWIVGPGCTSAPASGATYLYPQSFGALCDGIHNDGAAFQKAVNVANPGDTIIVYSPANTGCLIATGFTISTPLTLATGAPGYPTAQLLAGANSITMITVSAAASVTLNGPGFDNNSKTGVTALAITGANNVTVENAVFRGNFSEAVDCTNSYPNINFKKIEVFGAQTGLNLHNQCNTATVETSAFLLNQAAPASAIISANNLNTTIVGSDFECASQIAAYNTNGVLIHGNHFENNVPGGCAAMTGTAFIGLGASYGASPVFGASVEGNEISSADWGINFANCQGCESSGNTFNTAVYAHVITTSPSATAAVTSCTVASTMVCTTATAPASGQSVALSGFINTGGHDWTGANGTWVATNVSGTTFSVPFNSSSLVTFTGQTTAALATFALTNPHIGVNNYSGHADSYILGYTGAAYADTTASNSTSLFINPLRFSWAMPVPQHSHVPLGSGVLYWETADGTNATAGSFHGLWNFAGNFAATVPITDLEASATGNTDSSIFNGNIKSLPQGSTKASPVAGYALHVFNNGSSTNSYFGQDDSSGSQCGTANAQFICGDNGQPLVIGNTSQAILMKHLPSSAGSGGLYVCADNTGKLYIKSSCP